MHGSSDCSRRSASNHALAVLAVVVLAANLAQAELVVDHYRLGDAQEAESLRIAIINDIQGPLANLDAAVDRLRAIDSVTPLSVVMVAGDFGGHIDPSDLTRQNQIIGKLNELSCPWVPLMGNHEINVGEYPPMRIAPLVSRDTILLIGSLGRV